jgi:hypothetical protein
MANITCNTFNADSFGMDLDALGFHLSRETGCAIQAFYGVNPAEKYFLVAEN